MATGTVKFFNAQKGFGFIVQDRGGPDVFVHISAVERAGMRNLNEGQKLSFDVQADPRSDVRVDDRATREQLAFFFRNCRHGEKTWHQSQGRIRFLRCRL